MGTKLICLVELEAVGFMKLKPCGLGGLLLIELLLELVLFRFDLTVVEPTDLLLGVLCIGLLRLLLLVFGFSGNFFTVQVEVALFKELLELIIEFLELDF